MSWRAWYCARCAWATWAGMGIPEGVCGACGGSCTNLINVPAPAGIAPARLVFDLELATPLPEVNGRPDWGAASRCGISVIGAWCTVAATPQIYLPASTGVGEYIRLARNIVAAGFEAVSWNGLRFDEPRISEQCPGWSTTITPALRHRDLAVIAGLYQLADKGKVSRETLTQALRDGVPPGYLNLVGYKPNADTAVLRGWSLVKTARATLGIADSKSGHDGAWAPRAWCESQYGSVIGYCLDDVYTTRALWLHAWEHGYLVSEQHGRVEIPREAL